jgi:hypothetical protein
MELRSYAQQTTDITVEQRDKIVELVRDYLARGQDIDGTFEFRLLNRSSGLDLCEYDYILLIDMGYSEDRERRKVELAEAIGVELTVILENTSLAVRLRLQNAGFVPYKSS